MDVQRELSGLFLSQHGAAAVAQAVALGVPRHRIDNMVERGYLRRVGRGIIVPSWAPETWHQRAMVGVLKAGHGSHKAITPAAISGPSAAALLGVEETYPDEIDIVSLRRLYPVPGFRFHQTSRLLDHEVTRIDGIPVTDALRTFIDCCELTPRSAWKYYFRFTRAGHFTRSQAVNRCNEESRQGRSGLVRARLVIDGVTPGAEKARSRQEDDVYRWIVEAGLPEPERNFKIPSSYGWDWEIDLYYPRRRLAIEVSPLWHHADLTVLEKDNLKKLDLMAQGIQLIEVTDGTRQDDFLRTLRVYL